jgi:hypothetical protein
MGAGRVLVIACGLAVAAWGCGERQREPEVHPDSSLAAIPSDSARPVTDAAEPEDVLSQIENRVDRLRQGLQADRIEDVRRLASAIRALVDTLETRGRGLAAEHRSELGDLAARIRASTTRIEQAAAARDQQAAVAEHVKLKTYTRRLANLPFDRDVR